MSRLRLRQVVLAAHDLAATERRVVDELDVELCYRDPHVAAFGLHNALFPVGTQLLEVISPTEDGTTAGRYLERRGGDTGYMLVVQTDEDLGAVRARLEAVGVRIAFEATVPGITGLHLHPRDVGGAIVSIDRADDWAAWPWAGPDWQAHVRTGTVSAITGVEIAADDPARACARWVEVLGRAALDATTIELDEGRLRFVAAGPRGEGLDAVELARSPDAGGAPPRTVRIAGCDVYVR